jgi:hypothetical protein
VTVSGREVDLVEFIVFVLTRNARSDMNTLIIWKGVKKPSTTCLHDFFFFSLKIVAIAVASSATASPTASASRNTMLPGTRLAFTICKSISGSTISTTWPKPCICSMPQLGAVCRQRTEVEFIRSLTNLRIIGIRNRS